MKKFRKLIPAFCMLLISAVLLGTSTYAWFSMNKTVTATGLSVAAKSNFTYLVISDTEHGTDGANYNITAVNLAALGVNGLIPVAHDDFGTLGTDNTVLSAKDDPATDLKYWFTKEADAATASDSSKAAEYVKVADASKYIYTDDLFINLAPNSEKASKIVPTIQLKVASADKAKTVSAVRVLLVSGSKSVEFSLNGVAGTDTEDGGKLYEVKGISATQALIENLTAGNETKVEVYVYYDGSDSTIFTNNFANVGKGTLTITFDVAD